MSQNNSQISGLNGTVSGAEVSLTGTLSGTQQMIGILNPRGSLSGGLSVPASMTVNNVLVATTAEWNSNPSLIGKKGTVYVYTDKSVNSDGEPVPGFKVGDGLAYLIDAPFNDDIMMTHANNSSIHITDEERLFWNNKVTAYLNPFDVEELILTKD